ncbi:DUF2207 domain-containing protein [Candidatus Babeliales bacterium]|nr:DUF2207 domain-containing protein [Candidatus Babeliales bacterium]MBP9843706.1 DUF2207 domain-containing protein [Candidatus Babeliales bacterium]
MYYLKIIIFLLFSLGPLQAHERISSFVSNIFVNTDATIDVEETIEVICEHDTIKHGIVREFPTKYRSNNGWNHEVGFNIKTIKHNDIIAEYTVKNTSNGKLIHIGNAYKIIPQGQHTYVIRYTTSHQLGFFKDHDEIYWNVTGNGWRLPIDKAEAYVYLPKIISKKSIKAEAYTGYQNEQGKNYTYSINNNIVHFATKHPLQKFQGLTVVAAFPKGFVEEPLSFQSIYGQYQYIFIIIWILLSLCILLGIFYTQRMNEPGIIIPLFHPPTNMMPSEVGFLNKRYFRTMLLSADVLDLAVHDLISIKYVPGFFYGGTYTLTKKNCDQLLHVKPYHKLLIIELFGSSKTLKLSGIHYKKITAALNECQKLIQSNCDKYIQKPTIYYYLSIISLILFFSGIIIYLCQFHTEFAIISPIVFITLAGFNNLFFSNIFNNLKSLIPFLFSIYTPEGRKKQDEIDGFKMYLVTAEVDRMNFIGTPPTKTPQLYEKYLPYAIALGVEEQWTEQFSKVFEDILQKTEKPYHYSWSSRGCYIRIHNFGSSFSKSISSASTPPGKSSGSGGKGKSGGGGGGGGGGGW